VEKRTKIGLIDNLSCVILAAGEGSRMKPVSLKVPKALSPIIDKPIIEHIINKYIQLGIKSFVIVIRSADELIRDYFNRNTIMADLKFAYQNEALGSGHALSKAKDLIKSDSFFVAACDNIVSFSHLEEMLHKFQTVKAEAVLSLQHEAIEGLFARSNVVLEGSRVMKIIEKPTRDEIMSDIMCLPVYLCRKSIFSYINRLTKSKRGEYELPQAFQMMIDEGKDIYGVFTDNRYDLTTPEDLLEINFAFLQQLRGGIVTHSNLGQDANIIPPIFISSGCIFEKNCSIGPYVVVGKNCTIGQRVKLSRCVILEGTGVAANLKIANKVLFDI
jgi:bifunctional UDP-N-acetylglucosamine pyrophosphorylase/glucosamine-1-phosphate N-acetyltransferase